MKRTKPACRSCGHFGCITRTIPWRLRAAMNICGDAISWWRLSSRKGKPSARFFCLADNGTITGPGQKLEGGRETVRTVDLATMPIYVRAGAIIPHGPVENYTEEKPNDPLTLRIYPGTNGRFTMIEDDGVTFSSMPMRLTFTWNDSAQELAVALEPGSRMRAPMTRHLELELNGTAKKAEFRGEPLVIKFESNR
jgi:hypothetical protein